MCVIALMHALAGRRIKYQASLGLEHRPFICSCAPASPPLHRLPATMAESYVLGPPALEIFPFGIWARPTPGLLPSSLLALLASPLVDHARRASRTLASWDQRPGLWQTGVAEMVAPAHERQSGATRPAQCTQSGLRPSYPGAFVDKPLTTGPPPGHQC